MRRLTTIALDLSAGTAAIATEVCVLTNFGSTPSCDRHARILRMIKKIAAAVSRRALRAAELISWIVGVVLLAKFAAGVLVQRWETPGEVQRFLVASARAETLQIATFPALSAPDQALWSAGRRTAYSASLARSAPSVIAVVRVPALRIEVPVYAGTSDTVLDRGAGWITTTARVEDGGNIGISAHRDSYFRSLKDVAIGDEIELQTPSELRRFRVAFTRIVEPSDTSALRLTDEDAITLITCYPFYYVGPAPLRYVVRGVELHDVDDRNVGVDTPAGLNTAIATGDAS